MRNSLESGSPVDDHVRDRRRGNVTRARFALWTMAGLLLGGGALLTRGDEALILWLLMAACGGAASASLLLARRFVRVTVRGASMLPTFGDGDRLLVKRTRSVRSGDVVVLEQPGFRVAQESTDAPRWRDERDWMIKRVVAAPGEKIPRAEISGLDRLPGERVPDGMLIVVGDNRDQSFDSRQIGFVPVEQVLGVPVGRRARNGL